MDTAQDSIILKVAARTFVPVTMTVTDAALTAQAVPYRGCLQPMQTLQGLTAANADHGAVAHWQ